MISSLNTIQPYIALDQTVQRLVQNNWIDREGNPLHSLPLPKLDEKDILRYRALRDKPIEIKVKIPKTVIVENGYKINNVTLSGDFYIFSFDVYLKDLIEYLKLDSMRVSGSSVYAIMGLKNDLCDLDLKFSDIENCSDYTDKVVNFLTQQFIKKYDNPFHNNKENYTPKNFKLLKRAILDKGLNDFNMEKDQYSMISLGNRNKHSVDLYFIDKKNTSRSYVTYKDNMTIFVDLASERMEVQGDFGGMSLCHYQTKLVGAPEPEKINFWGAIRCIKELCQGGRVLSQAFLKAIVDTIASEGDFSKILLEKGKKRLSFLQLHPAIFCLNLGLEFIANKKDYPKEILSLCKKKRTDGPLEKLIVSALSWCASQNDFKEAFSALTSYLHLLGFLRYADTKGKMDVLQTFHGDGFALQMKLKENLAILFSGDLKESTRDFNKYCPQRSIHNIEKFWNLADELMVHFMPSTGTPFSSEFGFHPSTNDFSDTCGIANEMMDKGDFHRKKIGFFLLCTLGEICQQGKWLPQLIQSFPELIIEEQNPLLRQRLLHQLIRYWQGTLEAESCLNHKQRIESLFQFLGKSQVNSNEIADKFCEEMAGLDHPQMRLVIFNLWQRNKSNSSGFLILEKYPDLPLGKRLQIIQFLAKNPGKEGKALIYMFGKLIKETSIEKHLNTLAKIAQDLLPHVNEELRAILFKYIQVLTKHEEFILFARKRKLLPEKIDSVLPYLNSNEQTQMILSREMIDPLSKSSQLENILQRMEELLKFFIDHPENRVAASQLYSCLKLYKESFGKYPLDFIHKLRKVYASFIHAVPEEELFDFFREMEVVTMPPEVEGLWINKWRKYFEENSFSKKDAQIFKKLLDLIGNEAKNLLQSTLEKGFEEFEIDYALDLMDKWGIRDEKLWIRFISFPGLTKQRGEKVFCQLKKLCIDTSSECYRKLTHVLSGYCSNYFIEALSFYKPLLENTPEASSLALDLMKGWIHALNLAEVNDSLRLKLFKAILDVETHVKEIPSSFDLDFIREFSRMKNGEVFQDVCTRMLRVSASEELHPQLFEAMKHVSPSFKTDQKEVRQKLLALSKTLSETKMEPFRQLPLLELLMKCKNPDLHEQACQTLLPMIRSQQFLEKHQLIKPFAETLFSHLIETQNQNAEKLLLEKFFSEKELKEKRELWIHSLLEDPKLEESPQEIHEILKLTKQYEFPPYLKRKVAEIALSLFFKRGCYELFQKDLKQIISSKNREFCHEMLKEFIHGLQLQGKNTCLGKELIKVVRDIEVHFQDTVELIRELLSSNVSDLVADGWDKMAEFVQSTKESAELMRLLPILHQNLMILIIDLELSAPILLTLSKKLIISGVEPLALRPLLPLLISSKVPALLDQAFLIAFSAIQRSLTNPSKFTSEYVLMKNEVTTLFYQLASKRNPKAKSLMTEKFFFKEELREMKHYLMERTLDDPDLKKSPETIQKALKLFAEDYFEIKHEGLIKKAVALSLSLFFDHGDFDLFQSECKKIMDLICKNYGIFAETMPPQKVVEMQPGLFSEFPPLIYIKADSTQKKIDGKPSELGVFFHTLYDQMAARTPKDGKEKELISYCNYFHLSLLYYYFPENILTLLDKTMAYLESDLPRLEDYRSAFLCHYYSNKLMISLCTSVEDCDRLNEKIAVYFFMLLVDTKLFHNLPIKKELFLKTVRSVISKGTPAHLNHAIKMIESQRKFFKDLTPLFEDLLKCKPDSIQFLKNLQDLLSKEEYKSEDYATFRRQIDEMLVKNTVL